MRIRILIVILAIISVSPLLNARLVRHWTYQEMFDKADLVVIARFVSTNDTGERTTLKEISPPPINVIGVVTEFKSNLILKGGKDIPTFQVHHYRLQSEEDLMIANGPSLVRFPKGHPTYLLFLIKEQDGRYAPVTGQTDPAALSVVELIGGGD